MAEVSRGEINDIISKYAAKDEKYRGALLADPKRILGMQMGQKLPDFINVKVVEETADTIYLVLPHTPAELTVFPPPHPGTTTGWFDISLTHLSPRAQSGLAAR